MSDFDKKNRLPRQGFYSLRYKIAFSVLTVFTIIYSLSMKYGYDERKEFVFQSARQESQSTTQILAATLYRNYSLDEDQRAIVSYIKGIQKYKQDILEIEVLNRQKEVIASNDMNRIYQTVKDDKVDQAFKNQMQIRLNESEAFIAINYPISAELNHPNKKVFGIIRLKVSLATQLEQLSDIAQNIIWTAILIATTIGVVVIYLSFTITKPLGILTKLLGQVNEGNLSVRASIKSRDELGFLGESFDGMVSSLSKSRSKNERYAKSLEETNQRLSRFNQAASRFVPAEFLNHLSKEDLTQVELGDAVLRKMTVLFLDIRNFTSLSEQMNETDNLSFVNALLKRLNPKINENGGFIDKFIGDAVMALFPRTPDDALQAAIGMRKELKIYNQERQKYGKVTIDFGIGINSGPLILGTVGSPSRMDTTVIGKTVNLASRMEGLTKTYHTPIVISENSYQNLTPALQKNLRTLGEVNVKGVKNAVSVYALRSNENLSTN